MGKYVDSDMIVSAREMDLLTYLRNYEPDELVRVSDTVYSTRTHDSLKISNGAWMWWSQGYGGYTALDYLIKVRGMNFVAAVELICNRQPSIPSEQSMQKAKTKTPLLLPQKAESNLIVIQYLCSRGIDFRIVQSCIQDGLIYESVPYHNAVFVGYDEKHEPRYASYRATSGARILGDCSGSDKQFSFRIVNDNSASLHLFESAIDLLSFATLMKLSHADYRQFSMISLSGIYAPSKKKDMKIPASVLHYLKQHPETSQVFIRFDNDEKGRTAAQIIGKKLSGKYRVDIIPPDYGKDYNDYLLYFKQRMNENLRKKEVAR